MTRDFDGADDYIALAVGGTGGTGAVSIACACRPTSVGALAAMVTLGNTGNPNILFRIYPGGPNIGIYDSATGSDSQGTTATGPSANAWGIFVVTKAAGSATPRFHRYSYSTLTWAHEAGGAAAGDPSVSGGLLLGVFDESSPSNDFAGAIAAAAVWRSELSDVLVEELSTGWPSWTRRSPAALWRLDQASVATDVTDLSGGGADETSVNGTAVSTEIDPLDFVSRTCASAGAGRAGTLAG